MAHIGHGETAIPALDMLLTSRRFGQPAPPLDHRVALTVGVSHSDAFSRTELGTNEMSFGVSANSLAIALWIATGSIAQAAGDKLPPSSIYSRFDGVAYEVVNGWGSYVNINGKRMSKPPHHGIDLDIPYGTPIHANFNGHVHEIKLNSSGGMEVYIMIDNQTLIGFTHLSRVDVQAGDQVEAGESLLGLSGRVVGLGDHIHYDVWKKQSDHTWKAVDPMQYLVGENGEMACLDSTDFWDFVVAGYQGKGPKHPWPACRPTKGD